MTRTSRRRSRQSDRLFVESLEPRLLMTRRAVLDFDGESLTAAEMAQGGWGGHGAITVPSFKGLFTAARPWLNLDGDADVDINDANLGVARIVEQVRFDYAPYNLNIIVGDQDNYQGMLTDATVGDVMVIVTGDDGFVSGAAGVSPSVDVGNTHDEIVWAFGQAWADGFNSAGVFLNAVARTVSHEMGHAFGLDHISGTPAGFADARTHHLMNTVNRDFNHDFNFQDITYPTDSGPQDAHQILSKPEVLGPSPDPWVAVLKPGQLTIHGDEKANTISVADGPGNQWIVTIDGKSYDLDASAPGLASINPYNAPMTDITILAGAGNDKITVTSLLGADILVAGEDGTDSVTVDDQANTLNSTYNHNTSNLISGSLTRVGAGTITYSAENFSAKAGSGADTFNVHATKQGVSVTLAGGGGNDRFNITPTSRDLDNLAGNVTVAGQDGVDAVWVYDQNNADPSTYTLTSSSLTRNGAATITYSQDESLTLYGGSNANTYNIQSTLATTPVTINGGAANDLFRLGNTSNSLESLKGGLTLKGLGGPDTVLAVDLGAAAGQTFTLTSTTLTRSGAAPISYSAETLTIQATGFHDTFSVTSSTNATQVTFIGNAGSDTLVGLVASNAFAITGFNSGYLNTTKVAFSSVENLRGRNSDDTFRFNNGAQVTGTIDGQGGNDTLDDSLSLVGVSVNLATGAATGTGGVSNIENVFGGSAADILIGNAADNILWGNNGNDFLDGGAGNDVLVGGAGLDQLDGGLGRDVLIGGRHKDNLEGGGGEDILIGASTLYDSNLSAQKDIRKEWARPDATPYATRINHLKLGGAGALNGATLLSSAQVIDDAISDLMNGETNLDWFLATALDTTDKSAVEVLN